MFKFSKIHIVAALGLFLLVMACNGHKKREDSTNRYENDRLYTDDFVLKDMAEGDFSGEPYQMGLDGSFDDFVFAYAANKDFQAQRTLFPLLVIDLEENDSTLVEKMDWEPDSLFTAQSFYTILYDKEEDIDIVSQPDLIKAKVELIYLESKLTKTFEFAKEDGIWMLKDIKLDHLKKYHHEEFIKFYQRFATDSLFQSSRLVDTLEYVTSNPNDDFEILETTLLPKEWVKMHPMLPADKLLSMNYGQTNDPMSTVKILAVKGIGNGFSNVFFFRLNKRERWELFKFDDVGV